MENSEEKRTLRDRRTIKTPDYYQGAFVGSTTTTTKTRPLVAAGIENDTKNNNLYPLKLDDVNLQNENTDDDDDDVLKLAELKGEKPRRSSSYKIEEKNFNPVVLLTKRDEEIAVTFLKKNSRDCDEIENAIDDDDEIVAIKEIEGKSIVNTDTSSSSDGHRPVSLSSDDSTTIVNVSLDDQKQKVPPLIHCKQRKKPKKNVVNLKKLRAYPSIYESLTNRLATNVINEIRANCIIKDNDRNNNFDVVCTTTKNNRSPLVTTKHASLLTTNNFQTGEIERRCFSNNNDSKNKNNCVYSDKKSFDKVKSFYSSCLLSTFPATKFGTTTSTTNEYTFASKLDQRRLPPLTCPVCWEIYFEADEFESHYRLMHNLVYLQEFGRVPYAPGPFQTCRPPNDVVDDDDSYVPQTDVACLFCFKKNINCSGTYSVCR